MQPCQCYVVFTDFIITVLIFLLKVICKDSDEQK